MGGVFINYRRVDRDHEAVVRELYERIERYFGEDQVFLDSASLVPGRRFPDMLKERVADCEVLLAVVHAGWADTRDATGARRLDDKDDWVRREIELALECGRTVVPVLLDDATMPKEEELPESVREFASWQAERLYRDRLHADLPRLIAVLESKVAPTWQPIPAPMSRGVRPGRWLGAGTVVSAVAVLLGVPAVPWGDGWVGTDDLPFTLWAAFWSCLVMAAVLASVGLVCSPLGRSVNSWEREMHTVKYRTYIRYTWPVGGVFVVALVVGGLSIQGGTGLVGPFFVVLCVLIGVGRGTFTAIRLHRRDKDLWARWPQSLPVPVTRPEVRRAAARLDLRTSQWLRPLSRAQREKAAWELADIGRALAGMREEAERSRSAWLRQDHPWLSSLYVLWLTLTGALLLTTGFAYRAAGLGTARIHVALAVVALIGAALSLTTMELAYRRQRRLRTDVVREIAERTDLLAERVAALSSPARTRPAGPVPRTEELGEPD
ncbi:toll/interleukin-1 receptor domain-containing protein [Streptomyces sp. NBC_01352]|uniref:toll/interleukin-1 receptor domain-containing protein n=1 Tax=Streptomyces sp. NBC_01352 TaxID=2903834 RepID=UPI002E31AA4E|nr:toll/interleukin-1 receptor domain-containing protein [Streptomyces sp. NBC_01352]